MTARAERLIDALAKSGRLEIGEYAELLNARSPGAEARAAERADRARREYYGNKIFIRGLLEISNECRNDCLYCGIRKSNGNCARYRLTEDEIFACCAEARELGFMTFVLQSGEGGGFSAREICGITEELKKRHGDCAVALSVGERSRDEYRDMRNAGADRYLLRHETFDREHYAMLHPSAMRYENRIRCLFDLKDLGFQVGCGFMVGTPGQTSETLAKDLKFIEEFQPEMCGIGPFIPHRDTPFRNEPRGDAGLTLYLISIIRLIKPNALIPATTALNTIGEGGALRGTLAGANVIMPNISPVRARSGYALYDGIKTDGTESAQNVSELNAELKTIGYEIAIDRGDIRKTKL